MGKGSSSSSQSQQTTTQDNRIAADNGAIVLSGGSNYTNDFSPEVAAVVSKIVDYSASALNTAGSVVNEATHSAEQAASTSLNTASQIANNAQLGQTSILTNPATLLAIAGIVGVFAFMAFRKK